MRVSVANSERGFGVAPEQSVLEAALAAGLRLPHGCRGGHCGACRARLLAGRVRYPQGEPLGLSPAEAAEGYVLLCRARALGDLCLEITELRRPEEAAVKRLPCRVEAVRRLGHDVVAVSLRLPAAESLDFEPGQYVDVLLPGGRRRSFSLASLPEESRRLELHVRRVAGGEFTERLFAPEAAGTLLTLEGPFGTLHYRAPPPAEERRVPMILVAGGTGLAPLHAILRRLLRRGVARDIVLYWGVRGEADLYAHEALLALERAMPALRYRPVLSEAPAGWPGRRGWVHEAVLAEAAGPNGLAGRDIYACGPPAMIAAVRRDFPRHGADPGRLFVESFDYAPPRHATSAATRS